MLGLQSRRGLFGVSFIAALLSGVIAVLVVSTDGAGAEIFSITLFAAASVFLGACCLYLVWMRCPRCNHRAFIGGPWWFASTWGALGNKCVHCGFNLTREGPVDGLPLQHDEENANDADG